MIEQQAMGAILLLALFACGQDSHTGSMQVSAGENGISLSGVYRDGEFVYAFAWPRNVPKLDTNDPSVKPQAKGIHFLYTAPDGLWFDGEKVEIPKDSAVFALKRDGSVVPILLNAVEIILVAELTNPRSKSESFEDGQLKQKLLSPFHADVPE